VGERFVQVGGEVSLGFGGSDLGLGFRGWDDGR
jgi:hypothetical protein